MWLLKQWMKIKSYYIFENGGTMYKEEIREQVIQIFEENGCTYIQDYDTEILLDSISFVSIVVGVEVFFDINIPDIKLRISELNTINKWENLIIDLLSENVR